MSNEKTTIENNTIANQPKFDLSRWVLNNERLINLKGEQCFNTRCYNEREINNAIVTLSIKFDVERTSTGIRVSLKN